MELENKIVQGCELANKTSARVAKEIVMDSDVCFLCTEIVSSNASIDDDKDFLTGSNGVCLQSICRYLKINPYSVVMESWKDFVANDCADRKIPGHITPLPNISPKCFFSVVLCEECQPVAEKLMSFIREIEVIQMLMQDQLETFHQILKLSEEKNYSHFSLQMTAEARLLQNLRKETTNKCFQQIKALSCTSAKVVVSKLDDESSVQDPFSPAIVSLPTSPKNNKTIAKKEVVFIPPDSPKHNETMTAKQEVVFFPPPSPKYDEVIIKQELLSNYSSAAVPRLWTCNTCKRKFRYRKIWQKHIHACCTRKRRFGRNHPENESKQFQQQKSEDNNQQVCLPTDNSNNFLQSILNVPEQTQKENVWKNAVVEELSPASCLVYTILNGNEVMESTSIIDEKLPINLNDLKCKKIENRFKCPFCSHTGTVESSVRYHVMYIHPEKLFSRFNLSGTSDTELRKLCKKLLKLEGEKCTVLIQSTTEVTFSSIVRHKNLRSYLSVCSFCNRTFKRLANFKYHLMTSHVEEMSIKLIQLQQDTIVAAVAPSTSAKDQQQERKQQVFSKDMQTNNVKKWKCGKVGCGRSFKLKSNFMKHKVTTCQTETNVPNTTKEKGYEVTHSSPALPPAEVQMSNRIVELEQIAATDARPNLGPAATNLYNESNNGALQMPSSSYQNYTGTSFTPSSVSTLQPPNYQAYIPPLEIGNSRNENWQNATSQPCNIQSPQVQPQATDYANSSYGPHVPTMYSSYSFASSKSGGMVEPVPNPTLNNTNANYDHNLDSYLESHAETNVSSFPSCQKFSGLVTPLENVFSTSRFSEVSVEQFKTHCLNVVQNELKLCTKRREIGDAIIATLCHHCHAPYRNQTDLVAHMCYQHHDLLSSILVTQQQRHRTVHISNGVHQNKAVISNIEIFSEQRNNISAAFPSSELMENSTFSNFNTSENFIFNEELLQPQPHPTRSASSSSCFGNT